MSIETTPIRRRTAAVPALADHGMNADETRHLHRAIVAVIANLSSKQLDLCAVALLNFLNQRQAILNLPASVTNDVAATAESMRALADKLSMPPPAPTMLDRRLGWVARSMRLAPSERAVLSVMARRTLYSSWAELMDMLPLRGSLPNVAVLSAMTGYPLTEIDQRLAPSSPLLRAHLLRDDQDGEFDATSLLKRIAMSHARKQAELMRWLVPTAAPSALAWSDFRHLGPQRDLAERAMRSGQPFSLMLYGEPGTGKSEFARLLASQIGREAVFVGLHDSKGREPSRTERFGHLSFLKSLCRNGNKHVLVMDEADDVLAMSNRRDASKTWINRAVEAPELPTIWILNDPRKLDPAVARRMNMAIGFNRPPLAVRERVIIKAAEREGIALSRSEQRQLANIPASPAQLVNGLAVARLASGGIEQAQQAIQGVLTAMGQTTAAEGPAADVYDPRWSTAQMDLADLAQRLGQSADKGWSLLLSGPSGTGKSAYARHLAHELGLEIEERRGADLLGPYIGETEAKIATAFATAAARKAMLLIDEADSFLFRRDSASKSWETSLVNEMLRQMENRRWPFVATTNLVDQLDPAAQRRFTMRVTFDAMTGGQVTEVFQAYFAQPWPAGHEVLCGLSPGDVAVVAHRARLLGVTDAIQLIEWLKGEITARSEIVRFAGFSIPSQDSKPKER
jgi:hypothetical protein